MGNKILFRAWEEDMGLGKGKGSLFFCTNSSIPNILLWFKGFPKDWMTLGEDIS